MKAYSLCPIEVTFYEVEADPNNYTVEYDNTPAGVVLAHIAIVDCLHRGGYCLAYQNGRGVLVESEAQLS